MNLRPGKSHSGFTLVEVIVAMGILILAILTLLDVFTAAAQGISDAGNTQMALQLGREKLESAVRSGYISPLPATVSQTSVLSTLSNGVSRSAEYTATVAYQMAPGVSSGLEEVNVTVSWKQKGKSDYTRSIELSGWVSP